MNRRDLNQEMAYKTYKDFFLVRIPVTINGRITEVAFPNGHSKPHLCCQELNITIELSESIGPQLFENGVHRINDFYYDKSRALLIRVDFLGSKGIQRFLSNKDTFVKQAFQNCLDQISTSSIPVYIDISIEFYLVCLGKHGSTLTVHQVTHENCASCIQKWKQSRMPEFTSDMFENPDSINTDEAFLDELEKVLQDLDEWITLGVALNIPTEDLKEIQRKYGTTEERRSQMLVKWNEIKVPLWSKLWNALAKINQDARLTTEDHYHLLYTHLEKHAVKWREIGLNLGFFPDELDLIESNPMKMLGHAKAYLSTMLNKWLQWAPGDSRGSKNFATYDALNSALNAAELGATAYELRCKLEERTSVNSRTQKTTENQCLHKSAEMERKQRKLTLEKQQMLTIKSQADGVRKDYISQEERIRKLNKRIAALNRQVKAKNDETAALQEQVQQLEDSDIIETLEAKITETKEEMESLQAKLAKKEVELTIARQAISATEKKYSQVVYELKAKRDKVQQLEKEVDQLKSALNTAYKDLQHQEETHKQHDIVQASLEVVCGEMESRDEHEFEDLQEQIRVMETELAHTENKLELAQKELQSHHSSDDETTSHSNLKTESSDLESDLAVSKIVTREEKLNTQLYTSESEQTFEKAQEKINAVTETQHAGKKKPQLTRSATVKHERDQQKNETETQQIAEKRPRTQSLILTPTNVESPVKRSQTFGNSKKQVSALTVRKVKRCFPDKKENEQFALAQELTDQAQLLEKFRHLLSYADEIREEIQDDEGLNHREEAASHERAKHRVARILHLPIKLRLSKSQKKFANIFSQTLRRNEYGPLYAALEVGNITLEWSQTSLIIPHYNPIDSGALFAAHVQDQTEWFIEAYRQVEDMSQADQLKDGKRKIEILQTAVEKKKELLKKLVDVIIDYNSNKKYGMFSNSQDFTLDALAALGIKDPPKFRGHLNEYLQSLKHDTSDDSEFETHEQLDAHISAKLEHFTRDEAEYLLCLYFHFHFPSIQEADNEKDWKCEVQSCQYNALQEKVQEDVFLLNQFQTKDGAFRIELEGQNEMTLDKIWAKYRDINHSERLKLAKVIVSEEDFRAQYFCEIIDSVSEQLVMEASNAFKKVENGELTSSEASQQSDKRLRRASNISVKFLLCIHPTCKQEHCIEDAPLEAFIQIENQVIQWNESSLVIPTEVDTLQDSRPVYKSSLNLDGWSAILKQQQPRIKKAVEENDSGLEIDLIYNLTRRKDQLFAALIRVLVDYNRTKQYDPQRCNNQRFVKDVCRACGIRNAPEICPSIKKQLQSLRPSRKVNRMFVKHEDLDNFVKQELEAKCLDIHNPDDMHHLIGQYFLFHIASWNESDSPNGWKCEVPGCQLEELEKCKPSF